MRTPGDDLPLVEHDDLIGGEHRADALGHEQHRRVDHHLADGVLHPGLGRHVEGARRVVEDQDPRAAHQARAIESRWR